MSAKRHSVVQMVMRAGVPGEKQLMSNKGGRSVFQRDSGDWVNSETMPTEPEVSIQLRKKRGTPQGRCFSVKVAVN
jgi:hypothetical protein